MSIETGRVDGRQTPTYSAWSSMKNRCFNPTNKDFARYGGRGITVCDRWMTFASFLADMGERPPGMTIDRRDNDGNYEPCNCRWVDRKTQRANTSTVTRVQLGGETFTLSAACDRLGLNYGAVRQRLWRGAPLQEALATPIRRPAITDLKAVATRLGVHPLTIHERIRAGWSVEEATTTPKTNRWRGQAAKG